MKNRNNFHKLEIHSRAEIVIRKYKDSTVSAGTLCYCCVEHSEPECEINLSLIKFNNALLFIR